VHRQVGFVSKDKEFTVLEDDSIAAFVDRLEQAEEAKEDEEGDEESEASEEEKDDDN